MIIDFFNSDNTSRSGNSRKEIMGKSQAGLAFSEDYKQFGFDYFDNPDILRGYGGYRYDSRYSKAVQRIAEYYNLQPHSRILEVGCAKGHILLEFHKSGFNVTGIDVSEYVVKNAHEDIRNCVMQGNVESLPFQDNSFDFVLGKEILPHVGEGNIESAICECMRVSKGKIFFEIQCGRTQAELKLIKQWDCTHQTLQTPDWWEALFAKLEYPGDVYYKILFPNEEKQ